MITSIPANCGNELVIADDHIDDLNTLKLNSAKYRAEQVQVASTADISSYRPAIYEILIL